jgi:hypothetical protein
MDKRPTSPMCPILQVRLLWGFWSHCELHYGTVVPYDGSSGKVINISYSSYFMSCWSHIFHAKFGPRWSNSFKFCELHVWQNNDIICDKKGHFSLIAVTILLAALMIERTLVQVPSVTVQRSALMIERLDYL